MAMKNAIVFVDDELMVLQVLRAQAKKWFGDEYAYECAQSVTEAWEVIDDLAENGVEVLTIVSDWLMPDVRGDEFLIAVHQKYPAIVTMMLTGQADKEAIDRAQDQANLHRVLHKPWKEEDLIESIRTGLKKS